MRTERATATGAPRRGEHAGEPRLEAPAVLLLDLAAVVLFATVGRRTHAEGVSVAGVLDTAWPFVAGTITGWAAVRAWRRPASLATGAAVWVATLVLGMALRRATGDGTAAPFVVVAMATLAVLLLGWRVLAVVVPWLRDRRTRPEVLGR